MLDPLSRQNSSITSQATATNLALSFSVHKVSLKSYPRIASLPQISHRKVLNHLDTAAI